MSCNTNEHGLALEISQLERKGCCNDRARRSSPSLAPLLAGELLRETPDLAHFVMERLPIIVLIDCIP